MDGKRSRTASTHENAEPQSCCRAVAAIDHVGASRRGPPWANNVWWVTAIRQGRRQKAHAAAPRRAGGSSSIIDIFLPSVPAAKAALTSGWEEEARQRIRSLGPFFDMKGNSWTLDQIGEWIRGDAAQSDVTATIERFD